jgi:hypothetical protein
MRSKRTEDRYPDREAHPDREAQRRFEAALRGAREVGHKQLKDIRQLQIVDVPTLLQTTG